MKLLLVYSSILIKTNTFLSLPVSYLKTLLWKSMLVEKATVIHRDIRKNENKMSVTEEQEKQLKGTAVK